MIFTFFPFKNIKTDTYAPIRFPKFFSGGNIASTIGHAQAAMQKEKDTFDTGMNNYRSVMQALLKAGKLPYRHNAKAGNTCTVVYNG